MIAKRFQWLFLLLFFGAVIAALIFARGRFFETEISVASVERGKAIDAVSAVVRVRARREIDLRSELSGRILESDLRIGQKVEAGEILFQLDPAKLLKEREKIQLDLEREEAIREIGNLRRFDLEEQEEELQRRERLFDEGRISQREIDEQKRRVARLQDEIALKKIADDHRLRSLRNELARFDEELEKMKVRAPESGTVVAVFAYPDDLVAAYGIVARILSDERVIEASLSEENFAGVEPGQEATVRFLSYGSKLFRGRVAEVFPAADPKTQRYQLHLDVEMPDEMKIPGITGEASIVLGEREDTLLIPRRALVGRDVFVIRDGIAELQRVEIGFISLNNVEIRDGLKEGESIAVEKLDRLRAGDRVRF